MDSIHIIGGNPLNGVIPISGAKNAALPLMVAALLTEETLTLKYIPHLVDVELLLRILNHHGIGYAVEGRKLHQESGYSRTIHFTAKKITSVYAPYE
ncbi:MAG: UDP-N-acetylglucosamine 1-carboxyvinyltransferase, partial [Bartonella sp.]|nr:UDP-N-acetylglucosamine 1-carboxyvinyltransferase [Bartonella sp.]